VAPALRVRTRRAVGDIGKKKKKKTHQFLLVISLTVDHGLTAPTKSVFGIVVAVVVVV